MKKKLSRLWIGYLLYVLILLLLACALLGVLWHFLTGYQARYDERAAREEADRQIQALKQAEREAPQRAFEAFLESADARYWVDLWFEQNPDSLDSYDAVKELLLNKLHGEDFALWKAEEYTDEAPVYVLKNGSEALAKVWLAGSGTDWHVEDVRLLLEANCGAKFEVMTGVVVRCNGTVLDDSYITGEVYSYFPLADYEKKLSSPVRWVKYQVDGLLCPPEMTGEIDGVTIYSETDGCQVLLRRDVIAEEARLKAENFVKAVLYYYMSGSRDTRKNLNACLNYVAGGSEAYATLKASYDGITWNNPYEGPNTDDVQAAEAIYWAENCFSIDVSYHAYCTYAGQTVDYAQGIYRVYFLDQGKGFGIYVLSFE